MPDRLWTPTLWVSIFCGHAESKRIEAVVDSGSDFCLFHADIGRALSAPQFFPTGARRLSSSNQFSTTWICRMGAASLPAARMKRKRFPSGAVS